MRKPVGLWRMAEYRIPKLQAPNLSVLAVGCQVSESIDLDLITVH